MRRKIKWPSIKLPGIFKYCNNGSHCNINYFRVLKRCIAVFIWNDISGTVFAKWGKERATLPSHPIRRSHTRTGMLMSRMTRTEGLNPPARCQGDCDDLKRVLKILLVAKQCRGFFSRDRGHFRGRSYYGDVLWKSLVARLDCFFFFMCVSVCVQESETILHNTRRRVREREAQVPTDVGTFRLKNVPRWRV